MYAKYINEEYIIPAPKECGGVLDFDQKPEMMIQFDFIPVKDKKGYNKNKKTCYKLMKDYIQRYNPKEESFEELIEEEKLLAIRDSYLNTFCSTRKNTDITNTSSDGTFIDLNEEEEILNNYKNYLLNIENESNFPNIQIMSLSEFVNKK